MRGKFLKLFAFALTLYTVQCGRKADRMVNLNLETVLSFRRENNDKSLKFINDVQTFLTKLKNILQKDDVNLRRHNYNISTVKINSYKFTAFVVDALKILLTYKDDQLDDFRKVFVDEIKKYHYRGCKFHEITNHPDVRMFLQESLQTFSVTPIDILKSKMVGIIKILQNENLLFDLKDTIDLLNSLYVQDMGEKFSSTILDLRTYKRGGEKTKLKDNIRMGLRNILFDHYSNLNPNARSAFINVIADYVMKYYDKKISSAKVKTTTAVASERQQRAFSDYVEIPLQPMIEMFKKFIRVTKNKLIPTTPKILEDINEIYVNDDTASSPDDKERVSYDVLTGSGKVNLREIKFETGVETQVKKSVKSKVEKGKKTFIPVSNLLSDISRENHRWSYNKDQYSTEEVHSNNAEVWRPSNSESESADKSQKFTQTILQRRPFKLKKSSSQSSTSQQVSSETSEFADTSDEISTSDSEKYTERGRPDKNSLGSSIIISDYSSESKDTNAYTSYEQSSHVRKGGARRPFHPLIKKKYKAKPSDKSQDVSNDRNSHLDSTEINEDSLKIPRNIAKASTATHKRINRIKSATVKKDLSHKIRSTGLPKKPHIYTDLRLRAHSHESRRPFKLKENLNGTFLTNKNNVSSEIIQLESADTKEVSTYESQKIVTEVPDDSEKRSTVKSANYKETKTHEGVTHSTGLNSRKENGVMYPGQKEVVASVEQQIDKDFNPNSQKLESEIRRLKKMPTNHDESKTDVNKQLSEEKQKTDLKLDASPLPDKSYAINVEDVKQSSKKPLRKSIALFNNPMNETVEITTTTVEVNSVSKVENQEKTQTSTEQVVKQATNGTTINKIFDILDFWEGTFKPNTTTARSTTEEMTTAEEVTIEKSTVPNRVDIKAEIRKEESTEETSTFKATYNYNMVSYGTKNYPNFGTESKKHFNNSIDVNAYMMTVKRAIDEESLTQEKNQATEYKGIKINTTVKKELIVENVIKNEINEVGSEISSETKEHTGASTSGTLSINVAETQSLNNTQTIIESNTNTTTVYNILDA